MLAEANSGRATFQWNFVLPRRKLRMIPQMIARIRVDEGAERAAVNHQPWDEGAELLSQLEQSDE